MVFIEIFKLFGSIFVDNKDANEKIDDTGKKGEGLGGIFHKVGDIVMGFGKVAAAGLAAGAAAFAGLSVKALQLSGELEQNMGGAEAVFGEFADTVKNKGKTAFETMGLSMSDFLATSNKMGALFQGAGFGIEESADISTKAMQRAADVASIMGIDTSTAMESITGAAKGNFTMMDNLGVAMNDTSIGAYALSKGIQTSTKDMTTQEKIGLAMEMFLEKTAYAAGNYAKENETLSGSLSTAKAALTNFLSGAGDIDDVISSAINLAEVVAENLQELLPRLAEGLPKIFTALAPMIPPLFDTLLPAIADGAIKLVTGLAQGIIENLPVILSVGVKIIKTLLEGIFGESEQIDKAFELIFMAFDKVAEAAETSWNFISGLISENSGAISDVLKSTWDGIVTSLTDIWEIISETATEIFESLLEFWEKNGESILDAITNAWDAVWNAIKVVWDIISDTAEVVFGALKDFWDTNGKKIIETFSSVWQSVWNIIKPIWDTINDMAQKVFDALQKYWDTWGGNVLTSFKIAFDTIKEVFSGVLDAVQGIFKIFEGAFTGNWNKMWDGIKQTFGGIWEVIKSIMKGSINFIINGINSFINGINRLTIPDWVPAVGGKGVNIPTIPMLAEGGNITKSGWALVGERGPELLNLNKGAEVRPLDRPDRGDNTYILQVKMDEIGDIQKLKKLFENFSQYNIAFEGVRQ